MSKTNWTEIGSNLSGLYWISGVSDADETFVTLAHVTLDFNLNVFEVEPIAGGWSDEHCITHYAPLEIPEPPTERTGAQYGQIHARLEVN